MSKFLRNIKSFVGAFEIERKIKNHFKKLMKHSLIDLNKVKKNRIYDLVICVFIDILRISAPEIPLENAEMDFYLEMLVTYITLEDQIKAKSDLENTPFFYILHQMAKLSALCLLFTTWLIEKVPSVIHKFFYFLEKKKYTEQQFQDFLECISSTVNEYSEIPFDLLEILLTNLCKDKKKELEKQAYEVAYIVIKENKPLVYIYNTHDSEEYKNESNNNSKTNVKTASMFLKNGLLKYNIFSIVEEKSVYKEIKNNNYNDSYKISRKYLEEAILNNDSLNYFIDIHPRYYL